VNSRKSWSFSFGAFSREAAPVRVRKTHQNLEPFAGVGVTNRRHKETEAEGQHENVEHLMFLRGDLRDPKDGPRAGLLGGE
jgi:hypothetical protein